MRLNIDLIRHQQHRPRLVPAYGPGPDHLWIACLLAARNQRILAAWNARQDDNARRAAAVLPPLPPNGATPASPNSPPGRPN
jgi:hypothetical protein